MSRGREPAGALVASITAGVSARLARAVLRERPPGGAPAWERTNHRGEPVSLLAGPALAVGLVDGVTSAWLVGAVPGAGALGAAVAVSNAAAFGLLDDLGEDRTERAKGLRGHLAALRRGTVTTGALKIAGIGLGSGVAAAILATRRGPAAACPVARVADVLLDGALIAGCANLVNLLDLRPGRALKAGLAAGPALLPAAPAVGGAVLGAVSSALGPDLAERDMLGDCGANALGAALGAGATAAPRPVRATLLAGVVALTLASERVSFSAVIDKNPVLRAVDRWGRRP